MAELYLKVCDICAANDERVEAALTFRFIVDDAAKRIDLCEAHVDKLGLPQLLEAAVDDDRLAVVPPRRQAGAKPKAELLQSRDAVGCPLCFKLISSVGNLRAHVKKQHLRKYDEWSVEEKQRATLRARQQLIDESA